LENITKLNKYLLNTFELNLNKGIFFNDMNLLGNYNCDNNVEYFNCNPDSDSEYLFDGAAIGQYLGGVDPRNNSSNSIGFVNEQCIFNVSNYKYIWKNNEPYMIINGSIVKINNLHIHCKDLKKFMKI
jgi:hypothetical protein